MDECVGENNCVIASWVPHPTSRVTGYVLEMEEGDGEFKVDSIVYVHHPDSLSSISGSTSGSGNFGYC